MNIIPAWAYLGTWEFLHKLSGEKKILYKRRSRECRILFCPAAPIQECPIPSKNKKKEEKMQNFPPSRDLNYKLTCSYQNLVRS
jgi:hypothetical protein